jgi:hypothetical protein
MKSFSYPASECGPGHIFYFAQVSVDVVDVWVRPVCTNGPRVRWKVASILECCSPNPALALDAPLGVGAIEQIIQIIRRREHLQPYIEREEVTPEVPL